MRVVTYSRVSTVRHEQRPEIQVEELRRYCKAREWEIVEEVVDHGYSGSTTSASRPGLKRIMELARSRSVDGVVVLKMDRLFRSLKHLVSTLEEFEALRVKFVATNDGVDYSTPQGRLFTQILASLSEFEKALLVERTLLGLAYARSIGKRLGRPRKYSREEIIRLRGQGLSYRQIAKRVGASATTVCEVLRGVRKTPVKAQV